MQEVDKFCYLSSEITNDNVRRRKNYTNKTSFPEERQILMHTVLLDIVWTQLKEISLLRYPYGEDCSISVRKQGCNNKYQK